MAKTRNVHHKEQAKQRAACDNVPAPRDWLSDAVIRWRCRGWGLVLPAHSILSYVRRSDELSLELS
jgi:hypothetical protein